MIKEKLSPELTNILIKMCESVGANYDELDLEDTYWYLKYEWTETRQAEFKKWLVSYLKSNKTARFEFLGTTLNNKLKLEKVAADFVFNHGWKLKFDDTV